MYTLRLHVYPGDHSASLGWHQDTQSAVTVLLMMSDQNEYEGGVLQHEYQGDIYAAPLKQRGDVAVYRSHQYHRVTNTTKGMRVSMAIEFWHVAAEDPLHYSFWGKGGMASTGEKAIHDGRPVFEDAAAPFHDVCPR